MYAFNPNILPWTKGVFIVGGSVRDLLIGKTPSDYDLVVMGNDAESFARQMATHASGHYVCLGKENLQIHRVISRDYIFDVAPAKDNALEEDLKDRDFSLNALAFCLETKKLIDICGGLKDIKDQKVRMVSDTIFKKDPIRLLRAFRVANDLGFTIEADTLGCIKKDAHLIQYSAPERIHDEWLKLLSGKTSYAYLTKMLESGLLYEMFPELIPLKACEQNDHHAYNVLKHSLVAYQNLEQIFNHPASHISGTLVSELSKWETKRKALLKHTLLFHDIGKPSSRSVHDDGSVHFHKHAAISENMVKELNTRIRFSNFEADYTSTIIRQHNRPLNLFVLHQTQKLQPKHAIRFFAQSDKWALDIILHSIADHRGKGPQRSGEFTAFVLGVADAYVNSFRPKASAPKLINGNDLIDLFHLPPSPLFKKLLDKVEEKRLLGEVRTRDQAIAWIDGYLAQKD